MEIEKIDWGGLVTGNEDVIVNKHVKLLIVEMLGGGKNWNLHGDTVVEDDTSILNLT